MPTPDSEKNQHLIPRVYLSKWANSSGTILSENKGNNDKKPRNIRSLCTINNFFSIRAGYACCTETEAAAIFEPLEQYHVYYGNELIESPLKLNSIYYDFGNWTIKRKDGSIASKKTLKAKIEQQKVNCIEKQWSIRFESRWNEQISLLECWISENGKSLKPDFDFITKFILTLDWRSIESNALFQGIYNEVASPLDEIKIPKSERELIQFPTASEEIKHEILLKGFRKMFNGKGMVYNHMSTALQATTPLVCITDACINFQTSDNPSFVCGKNGEEVHLCPATPKILIALIKRNDKKFLKPLQLNAITTCRINKAIRDNASSYIFHSNLDEG